MDGKLKTRPALVLANMPPYGDHLLAGISSQLRHEVKGLDEIISPTDQDYPASGLKVASLIRMGMIATLPSNAILGRVGSISSLRLTRLMGNFIAAMNLESAVEDRSTIEKTLISFGFHNQTGMMHLHSIGERP